MLICLYLVTIVILKPFLSNINPEAEVRFWLLNPTYLFNSLLSIAFEYKTSLLETACSVLTVLFSFAWDHMPSGAHFLLQGSGPGLNPVGDQGIILVLGIQPR